MLTAEDKKQLAQKGISEQQIENQLRQFREGFPYLKLRAAATIGNGIIAPSDSECQAFALFICRFGCQNRDWQKQQRRGR